MHIGEELQAPHQAWHFKLVAGHVGLDFLNTVDEHATDRPVELLPSYTALIAWCGQAGLIDSDWAGQLGARARRRPDHAATVWQEAIDLREAGYRLLSGRSDDPGTDLAIVNRTLHRRVDACRIVASDQNRRWEPLYADDLGAIVGPIALHLASVLSSVDPDDIRECEAPGCGWLFLDTSRSGRRRWCSMAECGNRIKARRHYERQRKMTATTG